MPTKVEELHSIRNSRQKMENESKTAFLKLPKFWHIKLRISHQSWHINRLRKYCFHIIEMSNGLELNSITYCNPQTNKSNIAQGQNAFYVT